MLNTLIVYFVLNFNFVCYFSALGYIKDTYDDDDCTDDLIVEDDDSLLGEVDDTYIIGGYKVLVT